MRNGARGLLLTGLFAVGGCVEGVNRGWDFGGEPDPAGGPRMQQAWRGVHEGRIGFRCREGQIVLFVETWHPLKVPPGQRVPMELGYQFDVAGGQRETIRGMATSRGIEVPAEQVGDGASNTLLRGLRDDADELLVTLDGAAHGISILFDIEDAAHAHRHVRDGCPASPQP